MTALIRKVFVWFNKTRDYVTRSSATTNLLVLSCFALYYSTLNCTLPELFCNKPSYTKPVYIEQM